MKKLLSAVLASLVVTAVGCSHEVESPKVTGATNSPLTPNMVCRENRTSAKEPAPIVITGTGFTPLPTKTLSNHDAPTLVLPTVELKRTGELVTGSGTTSGDAGGTLADGGTTGGSAMPTDGETDVVYSGTPGQTNAANLSWQSEQQMTANVTKSMPLIRPGVYDTTVTNPDKTHKTTLSDSLAVVPAPVVTKLQPPTICVDQTDQKITVYGGFFAKVNGGSDPLADVPSVTIYDSSGANVLQTYHPDTGSMAGCQAAPSQFKLELCDSFSFTVKVNDLTPGTYKVLVTDPSPLDCDSGASNELTLTVHAPPEVDAVVPSTVCSGGSILAITGKNLYPGASAELRCGTAAPLVATSVVVAADNQHATVTFGPGAVPGVDCDFVFINQDSCEDRPLPHKKVTGTDGPILFNVDPNYVYSDMATSVKLYVTAITMKTPGTVPPVKMWLHGSDPSTAITLTAQYAPGKTNVLEATIPKGTAVGTYDMQVIDDSGCMATMPNAVTVTNTLVVTSGSVEPPFGHSTESVPITITLASDPGATGAPRAFLAPTSGTGPGIQVLGLTVTSSTTMTAVVPANTGAGAYQIVIVWPDGKVAVINAPVTDGGVAPVAYTSVANAPPVITNVSPQSVISQAGQTVTITGSNFANDATVSFICTSDGGITTTTVNGTAAAPTCAAGTCTMSATFDASQFTTAGSFCLVRVTNVADNTYGTFSALGITNASKNLPPAKLSQNMNTGRRALVSAAVQATSASRFVYAIGGDDGNVANAMNSMEFAPVSVFGAVSPWVQWAMPNQPKLTSKRTFAGTATIGRYIYVFGGNDGAGSVNTAERALVLSPEESPVVTDLDLCLAGGTGACFGDASLKGPGLDPGLYSYRVSANISATDSENCGGETLASDPMILRLANSGLTRKVIVKITWDQPRDSLGQPLSGVTGYDIYRTPKDGSPGSGEVLLATVSGATTLTFNDDGSKTPGTQKPLPLGSTSAWQATIPMGVKREGPGGAAAMDPSDPSKWYVYATLGRVDATTGNSSYELLPVAIQANGRQLLPTAGTWTAGAGNIGSEGWQVGTWSVNNAIASGVSSPNTFVYVGFGRNAAVNGYRNEVYAGAVQPGGQLGTPASELAPTNFAGYGLCAIADQLFGFGGANASPATKGISATISPTNAPTLEPGAWNAGINLVVGRYLMGSAIQSAFIFIVGGQTAAYTDPITGTAVAASAASTTTETIVW